MNTNIYVRFAIFLCCFIYSGVSASADSVYDRVTKSGKIRAGYTEWYPLLIKDPNTKKVSGIGYDALVLAASRLGLKLELTEEVSWGTMIEGLKSNRYDIIACPVWANSQRARVADFSRPIIYSQICAFTKYGDKRLDAKLSGVGGGKYKITCIDGEMSEMIARADYPTAKRLSLPQMAPVSDLLLNVSNGKADLAFTEPIFAAEFLKHNPKTIQNITPDNPVRIFPNVYMFKTGESEFKAMLNTALDEIINSGEFDKIVSKYAPNPKSYLKCTQPFQR